MKEKTKERINGILGLIATVAVAVGLLTRALCIRDTKNYRELQPELTAPDVIASVLHDSAAARIYVCYNDASYVNVYTEEGEFLWAVSTPYLRNADFVLQSGRLMIIGNSYAYVYDAADGRFLELLDALTLDPPLGGGQEATGEFAEGQFYFDSFQVYRVLPDGSLETVVSRPWWYSLTNFVLCWCVAFLCGMGCLGLAFLEKFQGWRTARKRVTFESRKARIILVYLKVTSVVQLLFALADVAAACLGYSISIGLMAVGIHFIVSNWVIWNLLDNLKAEPDQRKVLSFWKAFEMATFVAAFFSVIVAEAIAGNLA